MTMYRKTNEKTQKESTELVRQWASGKTFRECGKKDLGALGRRRLERNRNGERQFKKI